MARRREAPDLASASQCAHEGNAAAKTPGELREVTPRRSAERGPDKISAVLANAAPTAKPEADFGFRA
jgi:hypothetical protein